MDDQVKFMLETMGKGQDRIEEKMDEGLKRIEKHIATNNSVFVKHKDEVNKKISKHSVIITLITGLLATAGGLGLRAMFLK